MAEQGIAIGAQAIQAALKGSEGLRLETLSKFAEHFGCSIGELLGEQARRDTVWPFKTLTPQQFRDAHEDIREAAEDMLLKSAAKQALGGGQDQQPEPKWQVNQR